MLAILTYDTDNFEVPYVICQQTGVPAPCRYYITDLRFAEVTLVLNGYRSECDDARTHRADREGSMIVLVRCCSRGNNDAKNRTVLILLRPSSPTVSDGISAMCRQSTESYLI